MYDIKPGEPVQANDPEANTPDFFTMRLLNEILDRKPDLESFQAYMERSPLGNAYLPNDEIRKNGLEQLREMARNNYAGLIVSATTARLGPVGFRTGAESDETGDHEAMVAFERDDMGIKTPQSMQLACGYRSSYLVVDPVAKRQTLSPPTNAAVMNDVYGEPLAAITLQRDRFMDRDVLKLYLREQDRDTGEAKGKVRMFVATREFKESRANRRNRYQEVKLTEYDTEVPLRNDIKKDWVWWKQVPLNIERVPVTSLMNKDGKTEFEDHTDIIDRINYMDFQRVLIITMQSLRQRAIETADGKPLQRTDEWGNEIDYDDEFSAEPGAVWVLPEGAKLWESSPTDTQPILNAAANDKKTLGSLTYTPMDYFSDAVNQSAAGANNQQDSYLSKVEDRRRRFEPRLCRHMSIYFEVTGDTERADMTKLEVIWPPSKIETLIDKTAAFAALRGQGLAITTALREAMKMKPEEISRAESELVEEAMRTAMTNSVSQQTPIGKSSQAANSGGNNASAGGANQGSGTTGSGAGGNGGDASQRSAASTNRSTS